MPGEDDVASPAELVDEEDGLVEAVLLRLPLVVSLVELRPAPAVAPTAEVDGSDELELAEPVDEAVGDVAVLLTEYSGAAAVGDGIEAADALAMADGELATLLASLDALGVVVGAAVDEWLQLEEFVAALVLVLAAVEDDD